MNYFQFLLILATSLFFIFSCAPPQATKKVPKEVEPGQLFFHRACASCHGVDALGKHTRAPSLIDPEYLSENFSDEEIKDQIIEGFGKMPSQRNKVSDSEIEDIIKYLRYSQQSIDLTIEDDDLEDSND